MSMAACAQFHARRGRVQTQRRHFQHIGGQRHFAQVAGQRQSGVAERAADPDIVAVARGIAAQGLPRQQFTENGDADRQRAAGRIAADQFAVEGIGQREQAGGKCREPLAIRVGQRQRQREGHRPGAHRRQIRQIDRQAFMTERMRFGTRKKVPSFDQHVRRDRRLHARRGGDQRAVVADAQHGPAGFGALKIVFDQVEFGKHDLIVPKAVTPWCRSAAANFRENLINE